ncbi:MAG: GTPase Era [Trichlorobacter sp.]|uniref:GTPase Era n=1 Tax=Trichlorobacter sp. TaxID=2911007 RepID=UPI0025612FD7|nr:GTPase Era [Trichlorobacter sp.]MDK9717819.1 GTPase Era [Trichlorobacter sp.]
MSDTPFKAGFVSIIGRPNVGKSTLLNRILGEKIVAVSDKPQTTRNVIRGILSDETGQIVFVDTPGIHTARTRINRAMVDAAMTVVTGVDLMLLVVDATLKIEEAFIKDICSKAGAPIYLVLNKIDQVTPKEKLFTVIEGYTRLYDFPEIIPISAQSGSNIERLVDLVREQLPEGVALFPDDILTDLPEKFIVAELIREKVFRLTNREVPYGTAVVVEAFTEREDGLVVINAIIMVERDSHKGIIIGKRGTMLKKIGEQARRDIERLLGTKVYLELFVQVQERWTERTAMLRELGYE